jgi:hypothetical protein
MMDQATALKTVIGMQEDGDLDGIGPNAMVVQLMGAKLIRSRMPSEVRKEMMDAVKQGKLGHIKKEGLRPEAFHHPNARAHALDLRAEAFRQAVDAIKKTLAADGPL